MKQLTLSLLLNLAGGGLQMLGICLLFWDIGRLQKLFGVETWYARLVRWLATLVRWLTTPVRWVNSKLRRRRVGLSAEALGSATFSGTLDVQLLRGHRTIDQRIKSLESELKQLSDEVRGSLGDLEAELAARIEGRHTEARELVQEATLGISASWIGGILILLGIAVSTASPLIAG